MTEALDSHRTHDPAYVCGRLLAFLANCQDPDYFGTSAPILKRYFGSASTAPRAVFPTLLRQNRHHLSKIHDTFPKVAFRLEEELDQLLLLLKDAGSKTPDFPALLPLAAQGRFALGFYHQRADYRQRAEDRKRARAAKADQEPETAGSDQPS